MYKKLKSLPSSTSTFSYNIKVRILSCTYTSGAPMISSSIAQVSNKCIYYDGCESQWPSNTWVGSSILIEFVWDVFVVLSSVPLLMVVFFLLFKNGRWIGVVFGVWIIIKIVNKKYHSFFLFKHKMIFKCIYKYKWTAKCVVERKTLKQLDQFNNYEFLNFHCHYEQFWFYGTYRNYYWSKTSNLYNLT